MTKLFSANFTTATHDDANTYTSGCSKITHPCPLIAAMLSIQIADAIFDENCRKSEYAGSGCCVLDDGHIHATINGEEDLSTYWSFDRSLKIKTLHRSPELVNKIKEDQKKKATA
jgi:hypothetical protein